MRTAPFAAAFVVALCATGLAALTTGGGAAHFPGFPARAHQTLGPVAVLARPGPDAPVPLAEAARARYGRIDALARVRTEPLPWSDGALISGIAVRWE